MTLHHNQTLRRWQAEALASWRSHSCRGIVEVATGGGKTQFAESCYFSIYEAAPDTQIVVVVPTVALLDQWYVSLGEDLNASPNDIAVYSGRRQGAGARQFNLAVINSLRGDRIRPWRTDSMLVVDECHRAGSPVNATALRGSYKYTLGLSATPERQYDAGMDEYVVPALGPVIYTYGIRDAERDGILSPFELVNVEVPLQTQEQEDYDRLTRRASRVRASSGDSTDDRLESLLRRRARVANRAVLRVPVTAALVDRHRGSRLIVFHEEIDSAERIAKLLSSRNHSVTTYHSHLGPSTRRENLRLFRRGVYDVLVCCRALDEGINVPEVSVAIIAAATASHRQRIQRLGRVLRPSQGKDFAVILTLFSTRSERERLREEEARLAGVTNVTWMSAG